jgi:hypothetical protein
VTIGTTTMSSSFTEMRGLSIILPRLASNHILLISVSRVSFFFFPLHHALCPEGHLRNAICQTLKVTINSIAHRGALVLHVQIRGI